MNSTFATQIVSTEVRLEKFSCQVATVSGRPLSSAGPRNDGRGPEGQEVAQEGLVFEHLPDVQRLRASQQVLPSLPKGSSEQPLN